MEIQLRLPIGHHPVTFDDGRVCGPLPDNSPLVISYGAGVDSTAMLIGLKQRGVRPDAVLFAEVGNEKPETYAYLGIISEWLYEVGFPELTTVKYTPQRFKHHRYCTLAGNCLANRTLPSLAFYRKSCSLKWKGEPLDKTVKKLYGDTAVYRAIGYDCSPRDNKRFAHAVNGSVRKSRKQDIFIYPLQLWMWHRDMCKEVIRRAGLPVPPKSSCTFCPSMKPEELDVLPPHLLREIVIIEANASPNLRVIKGLWRKERMTDYIVANGLLPEDEVQAIWAKWSGERAVTEKHILAEDVLKEESR